MAPAGNVGVSFHSPSEQEGRSDAFSRGKRLKDIQAQRGLAQIQRLRLQLEDREAKVQAVLDSAFDWILFPFEKSSQPSRRIQVVGDGIVEEADERAEDDFCNECYSEVDDMVGGSRGDWGNVPDQLFVWDELDGDEEWIDEMPLGIKRVGASCTSHSGSTKSSGRGTESSFVKLEEKMEKENDRVVEDLGKRKRGRPRGSGKKNKALATEVSPVMKGRAGVEEERGSPTSVLSIACLEEHEDEDVNHNDMGAEGVPATVKSIAHEGQVMPFCLPPPASDVAKDCGDSGSKDEIFETRGSLRDMEKYNGNRKIGRPRGRPRKYHPGKAPGNSSLGKAGSADHMQQQQLQSALQPWVSSGESSAPPGSPRREASGRHLERAQSPSCEEECVQPRKRRHLLPLVDDGDDENEETQNLSSMLSDINDPLVSTDVVPPLICGIEESKGKCDEKGVLACKVASRTKEQLVTNVAVS